MEEWSESEGDGELEEWMILGGEEQEGDRDIQLNLYYYSTESEELNEEANDGQMWAVSQKDGERDGEAVGRVGSRRSLRYFLPLSDVFCSNCRKNGHKTWSCPTPKKRLCCVLCGLQGHLQSLCPQQYCSECGLPAHTHTHLPCARRAAHTHNACPLHTHCQQRCPRCGLIGHLQDACPDIWRQYHLTTRYGAPIRPEQDHTQPRPAHCYNCARRGHYGHECVERRMLSGFIPSVPFVCLYNTEQDFHTHHAGTHSRVKGLQQLMSEDERARGESQCAVRQRGRTWPEKRRERREIKRLRRDRMRRGGGGEEPHSPFKAAPPQIGRVCLCVYECVCVRLGRRGDGWVRRRKSVRRSRRDLYPLDENFLFLKRRERRHRK